MDIYNQAAGKNRDRLAALSDGVFAFAMTVVVLDIRVPEHTGIATERDLLVALSALTPHFAVYLLSFLTLGIFWVGQQMHLNLYARTDRDETWIHFAFLTAVATLPFSTSLLASYITFRTSLVIYWLNILFLGFTLLWAYQHAKSAGLFKAYVPPAIIASIPRRALGAQALYALGALLCLLNTYWSIAFIIIVQLYYALAPDVWLRRHLHRRER
jgi:uncharacterized membrane protein